MIINTESVVGFNNNLRRATDDMKLGVNNHVNQGTKKALLKLIAGGPSKVKPPNSHPEPSQTQYTNRQQKPRVLHHQRNTNPNTTNATSNPRANTSRSNTRAC